MTNSGAPGPVLIDFPIDVLFSPPQHARISWGAIAVPTPSLPGPDPSAIVTLVQLWTAAKRPIIITGTGARASNEVLIKLASKMRTPVFYSSKYSNAVPYGHELRGGPATNLAKLLALGKPQPDFVVLLGARTGFLLAGRSGTIIPSDNCNIVQVDVDGGEIGKSLPIDLAIVSDASLFCEAVLEKLAVKDLSADDQWVQSCSSLKDMPSSFAKDARTQPDGRLHPFHAMQALMTSLPPDSIITIDGGEAGQWALGHLEKAKPYLAMVSTGYLGFLGNGWGYSLGASIAEPQRLIVNIQGDGSAGFHIAELDTFARHGLRILTVVINNYVWGMSLNGQELVYGTKTDARPASKLSRSTAYEIVAQGFGCVGAKVEDFGEIQPEIERLSEISGPALLSLIVSDKPITPATRSMVSMTDDPDVIVVPYYDNVPRPYFKQHANGH